MLEIAYGFTRTFPGITPEEARPRVEAALKEEGFGILTEIDVKATLKKKLDAEFRKYWILGACNPRFAHQALQAEPGVGLLLPCNVVITEDDAGDAVVAIMDPQAMIRALPDPSTIEGPMRQVREMLQRALARA
jgi:uncharacterized protein (DUF302 family)